LKERRAIFINTASQILVRIVTLAFTLVSIKILTNYLSNTDYGNLNTITAYVNYFLVIADLGLFSVTVREISKNPLSEKKIISNVFFIRLVSSLLACFAAVGIIYLTPYKSDHNLVFGIMIACGFLFFNLMGSIGDMILQHRLKMQFSAVAEFLSKLISLGALVLVVSLKGNFLWIIFSVIAMSGILIFAFKWYFASKFTPIKIGYDRKIAKWIFNLAWPIGIIFIANNLFFRLDTIMLFAIKGAVAVSIYSVAYKILEVTVFFGSYFANSLKPIISRSIENGEKLKGLIEKSFTAMLLIALPIAAISCAYAKEIIAFLSNEGYSIGSPALIVLSLALPFLYFDILLGEILIAKDERKKLLSIAVFILLFNFIFNLIFIPRYSYMGAAYGTLTSEIILFFIFLYNTRKIVPFKVDFMGIIKMILVAILTLLFALTLKFLSLHFILGIIVSAIFFFFMAYLIGIVSTETIKSLLKSDKE
jgi:O-antigen/teichoic acid export membrane protein